MNGLSWRDALRNRTVRVIAVVAVLVAVIWLVAFFLPQGSKLSSLSSQDQKLQAEKTSLQAQLHALQTTQKATAKLESLKKTYSALVPSAPDTFPYYTQIGKVVAGSGAILTAVTITTLSGGAANGAVTEIPVSLTVTGSYDQILKLLTAIYAMPRLTTISSITLNGGGPNTTRATPLTASLTMAIYTTAAG